MSKVCTKCGQEKSLTDFYVNSRKADGRMPKCIECFRINLLLPENVKKIQERDRVRGQCLARKQIVKERGRKYKDKPYRQAAAMRAVDPLKAAARTALGNAVRDGCVIKPTICQGEGCGKVAIGRNLHGHHKDYSKSLEVDWLCTACHGAAHRRENEAAREVQAFKTAAE